MVDSIVLGLRGFHLGQRFRERSRVGDDRGIFQPIMRRSHARIGFVDALLDAIELALLQVGELLLAGRWCRAGCSRGPLRAVRSGLLVRNVALLNALPLLPLRVVRKDARMRVAIESEHDV